MTFEEWIEAEHTAGNHHTEYASAMMGWEAGRAAERESSDELISRLRMAMHDIYEVYAGSEGFIPETCSEAYLQERMKEMAYIAGKHKHRINGEEE